MFASGKSDHSIESRHLWRVDDGQFHVDAVALPAPHIGGANGRYPSINLSAMSEGSCGQIFTRKWADAISAQPAEHQGSIGTINEPVEIDIAAVERADGILDAA